MGTRRANHASLSSSTELLASNLRQVSLPFLAEATDQEEGLAADLLCLLFGLWKEICIKPFLQRINCETI